MFRHVRSSPLFGFVAGLFVMSSLLHPNHTLPSHYCSCVTETTVADIPVKTANSSVLKSQPSLEPTKRDKDSVVAAKKSIETPSKEKISIATPSKNEASIDTPEMGITEKADKEKITEAPVKVSMDKKKPALSRTLHLPPNPPELMLLRAIGNSLPPRHDPEQGFRNLNFTLHTEPCYDHVTSHWVLNRLVDSELEGRLIGLLKLFDKKYTVIPFDLQAYDAVEYDYESYQSEKKNGEAMIHKWDFNNKMSKKDTDKIEDAIMNDKNLFVTNQNEARNQMVEIGLDESDAQWILPWDGNCFLHPNGVEDITWALHNSTSVTSETDNGKIQKYFYTPMRRAQTNEEVLDPLYRPDPEEEPQVIFHRTAKGRFHPKLRYGRRNKVEFIQRMKVPGPWDKFPPYDKWEEKRYGPFVQPLPDLAKPASQAGWTTRLSSGQTHLEVAGTIVARGSSRIESLQLLFSKLDERAAMELHGYDPKNLFFFDEKALADDRELFKKNDPVIKPVLDHLLEAGKAALGHGPWSVMDKPKDSVGVSGDPHDYYHPAPYYWPVLKEDGSIDRSKPFQRRDGQRVPGTVLHDDQSFKFDRNRAADMTYNTTALALSYYFSGEQRYGEKAARNIRTWFIDPDTRMNPNLYSAQIRGGIDKKEGSQYGVIDFKDLYFLLDAVRLVERDGLLTQEDQVELRKWFGEYLHWLENSKQGRTEFTSKNNHGLYYDVQASAVASYIGNTARLLWYVDRFKSRIAAQIKDDGAMPHELARPTCEHYQMFTLQGFSTMGRMAAKLGRNLWNVKMVGGMSALCRAAAFAIPLYSDRDLCKAESEAENLARWWPLIHDARAFCPSLRSKEIALPKWSPEGSVLPPSNAYEMPPFFSVHDGIPMYWNLGLFKRSKFEVQDALAASE